VTVAVGPFSLFSEWLLSEWLLWPGYVAAARAADAPECLSGGDLFDPISIRYDLGLIGCLENSSAFGRTATRVSPVCYRRFPENRSQTKA